MAIGPGHSLCLCPPPISVQNDRYMSGNYHNFFLLRIKEAQYLFFVCAPSTVFYTVMISLDFSSTALSISFTYLSVDFWILSSSSLISSSDTSCLASFLNESLASLRTLRTATFAASPFFFTSFTSSFLRSSVSSGRTRRITFPSLFGFKPRSEARIAFWISFIREDSHGWIWIILASGTIIFATC